MSDSPHAAKLPLSDSFGVPAEERPGIRVLIVEYDRAVRETINAAFRLEGYTTAAVGCSSEAVRTLRRAEFDIVVAELAVLTSNDFDILRNARQPSRDRIIVAITDSRASTCSQALRAGAWDCLSRPFSATELKLVIGRAARAVLQTRAVRALSAELDRVAGHRDRSPIVGTSAAITSAVTQAHRVAPTKAPILIVGEPGTGKDLLARFIHQQSVRSAQPFITVCCSALPEPLLESEIFGSSALGSSADTQKRGLLEQAHGGTLFLDDISSMPLSLQAKLTDILHARASGRTELASGRFDVRFVSAMTHDPQHALDAGLVREDFLNGLGVARVRVPPLRERREDIPLLATHFLAGAWVRHRIVGLAAPTLSPHSVHFLRSLPWRGNVRELRDIIEHVAVRAVPNQQIGPEDIPFADQASFDPIGFDASVANDALREAYHTAKDRLLNEFERVYFRRLVDTTEGNLARAARMASIDRTTLYRLMEKHKIATRRNSRPVARVDNGG